MALCTSCGSQVEESASFCTSCGKPMPAAAHPLAAVTATRPVCSSCGAQGDTGSVFCTECGKRMDAQPVPAAEAAHDVAAAIPPPAEVAPATLSPAFCTNCGSKLEPGSAFCTNCGQQTISSSDTASKPAAKVVPTDTVPEAKRPVHATSADPRPDPISPEPVKTAVASSTVEAIPTAAVAEQPVEHEPVRRAPQIAPPLYAAPSDYPPAQPGGNAFRVIVLVLLLLIVAGGFGGWYFMGVETVIVCSPPDVTVFLDDKELAPTSYGRYVVPHLSRQSHLLKVQRAGFADTIERLDFPLTSLHEWVNIKLVPRPATRSSSSR